MSSILRCAFICPEILGEGELVDAIPDSLFSKQTMHLYPKTAMIQTCE